MGGSQCDVKEDTYFQVSTMNQTQAEGFLKSEKQIYGRSKQGVQPPIPLWGTWFSQTLRAENIKVSVKVMDRAWDGALPQSPISWIPLPSATDKPGAKSGERGANPSELVSFSRITGSGRQTQSSPVFLGPFYPTKQKPLPREVQQSLWPPGHKHHLHGEEGRRKTSTPALRAQMALGESWHVLKILKQLCRKAHVKKNWGLSANSQHHLASCVSYLSRILCSQDLF